MGNPESLLPRNACDRIRQCADLRDRQLDSVAWVNGRDARGCSCGHDIAGIERHEARDERQHCRDIEDE